MVRMPSQSCVQICHAWAVACALTLALIQLAAYWAGKSRTYFCVVWAKTYNLSTAWLDCHALWRMAGIKFFQQMNALYHTADCMVHVYGRLCLFCLCKFFAMQLFVVNFADKLVAHTLLMSNGLTFILLYGASLVKSDVGKDITCWSQIVRVINGSHVHNGCLDTVFISKQWANTIQKITHNHKMPSSS